MRLTLIIQRLKRNQTQQEVAKHIGISSQMVSDYERGKVLPSYPTMKKFSDYYCISVENLFGENANEIYGGDKK